MLHLENSDKNISECLWELSELTHTKKSSKSSTGYPASHLTTISDIISKKIFILTPGENIQYIGVMIPFLQ